MRELMPFIRDLRAERGRLAIGTTLLIVSLLSAIGLMGLSGWLISAAALAGLAGLTLEIYRPSAGIRFFAITRTLSRYFERVVHHDAVLRTLARLRGQLFRAVTPLPLAQLGRLRRSDLLNRMTADVDALDNLYLRVIGPTFAAAITVLVTVAVLAWFAPTLGLAVGALLLTGGVVLPLWAWRLGSPHGEAVDRHLPALRGAGIDAVQGLAELRACGAVERHEAVLMAAADGLAAARARAARLTGAGEGAVGLLGHAALYVALLAAIPLYQTQSISGPVLALAALAALAAGEALAPLPAAWQQLSRTRAAAGRLLEYAAYRAQPGRVDAAQLLAAAPLGLSLEGVTFRHQPYTEPVLRAASLDVAPGESVVIYGPSGSGKSTILDLLAGFVVQEAGRVALGGVDIADLAEADRFRCMTYLTQRTELFADTVAANLRVAAPEANDERLWQALTIAGLDDCIAATRGGLEEWVGEGGVRFSGGEARRLALARVVLSDAPVVLLDEPFRGLDGATTQIVCRRLEPWLAERTVVIVSHEPEATPHHHRRIAFASLSASAGAATHPSRSR